MLIIMLHKIIKYDNNFSLLAFLSLKVIVYSTVLSSH